jgi:hypothetical protein
MPHSPLILAGGTPRRGALIEQKSISDWARIPTAGIKPRAQRVSGSQGASPVHWYASVMCVQRTQNIP